MRLAGGSEAFDPLHRKGQLVKYHHIGIPTTKERPNEFLSFESEDHPLSKAMDGIGGSC